MDLETKINFKWKEIIKVTYDEFVRSTLNNQDLKEEELNKLGAICALNEFKYDILIRNGEFNDFNALRCGVFPEEIMFNIVKGHVLINGNKRLAMAIYWEISANSKWDKVNFINEYQLSPDYHFMVKMVKFMASAPYSDFWKIDNKIWKEFCETYGIPPSEWKNSEYRVHWKEVVHHLMNLLKKE